MALTDRMERGGYGDLVQTPATAAATSTALQKMLLQSKDFLDQLDQSAFFKLDLNGIESSSAPMARP